MADGNYCSRPYIFPQFESGTMVIPAAMDGPKKLVILDRDGVINHDSDAYIKSPEEWIPLDGSLDAIAKLSKNGYTVAVATNQSGIARGYFDEYTLARIHQAMCQAVERAGGMIDGVFFCPHGPDADCSCRKPRTGLLQEIAKEFDTDLRGVPLVGDSMRDLVAARKVGCHPFLVKTGKGRMTLEVSAPQDLEDVSVTDNLLTAVDLILENRR